MSKKFDPDTLLEFQPEVKLAGTDIQLMLDGELVLVQTTSKRHFGSSLVSRYPAGEHLILVHLDMDGDRVSENFGDKADLLAGKQPRERLQRYINVMRPAGEPKGRNWTFYQEEIKNIWVTKATQSLILARSVELHELASGDAQRRERQIALREIEEAERNLKVAQEKINAARQRLNDN